MEVKAVSETPAPPRTASPAPAAATAQPPTPETEVWAGRTSWKHYAGRLSAWIVGNLLFAVLVGWIASARTWLALSGAIWTVLVVVLVSGVIFILPVFIGIIGRRYRLTSQRLFIEQGILNQTIDQTELIRIDDVRVQKTLLDRVFGLGTVSLLSTDLSDRGVVIEGVCNADRVAEAVRANTRTQRGKAFYVENL
jgi:membrane protein YdbS with pleckstrin-like domain